MKIFQPEKLLFPCVKDSGHLALITGIVDLLAGIGIVLSALLRIQPKLTIYAAYGIIVLLIAASIFQILRGEISGIGFNIFMVLLGLFIAWARQTKAPITAKTISYQ